MEVCLSEDEVFWENMPVTNIFYSSDIQKLAVKVENFDFFHQTSEHTALKWKYKALSSKCERKIICFFARKR